MQDINLYHLLNFYAKKWIWIVLLTGFGVLIGFIYNNYIQTPLYKSDATLLIVSADGVKTTQDPTLINNYIQLIKSRRVLEPVLKEKGLNMSYDELAGATIATNEKNTEVIKVSIATKDPQVSKQLVDGVVISFREAIKKLYGRDNTNVVDNASLSTEPYNVRTTFIIIVTTITGLFVSLVILFFVYDVSLSKKTVKSKPRKAKEPRTKPRVRAQLRIKTARKTDIRLLDRAIARLSLKRKSKAKRGSKKGSSKKALTQGSLIRSAITLLIGVKPKPPAKKPAIRVKAKANNRKK